MATNDNTFVSVDIVLSDGRVVAKYLSSRQYQRLYEDPSYVLDLFGPGMTLADSNFDTPTVVETSTELEVSGHIPAIQTRFVWTNAETKLLIACVEARYQDFNGIKRMTFWKNICIDMAKSNCTIDSSVCEQKWKNLLRSYKKVKDNNRQSGRGRLRFEYYEEMDVFLGSKPNYVKNLHAVSAGDPVPGPSGIGSTSRTAAVVEVHYGNESQASSDADDPPPVAPAPAAADQRPNASVPTRKRKNPYNDACRAKADYYIQKTKYIQQKAEEYANRTRLQERHVEALETLAQFAKSQHPQAD